MNSRIRTLLSQYKPYTGLLLADLACAAAVAVIALALPLCARIITKDILGAGAPDAMTQIYGMGALMLALIAAHALCNSFVDYQGHMMGALMERDLRAKLFDHFQKLSFGYYDNQKTGQLMSRLTNDTFALGEWFHHAPEDIVLTSIKFIGTFVILLQINTSLTLILLLFLPFMAAFAFYYNNRMNRALRASRDRIGDINAQAEDTLSGIRVVKSFTGEAAESAKFARENDRFVESKRMFYRNETWFYNGMLAFTQLFTAALLVFGASQIVGGALDLADLLTYLLYAGILIEPIRTAVNFARLYQEGITGFDRIMEIFAERPDIQDTPLAIDVTQVRGRIELKGVSFGYREGQEKVLNDISLDIKAREYVALVGHSGVGKTTLCALIPRFYEVGAGAILLDGRDIRDISLRSLRANIGVVQQDVYLFAGSVAENIGYGKQGATRDEIVAAAKSAHAHEFIQALPQGYDTDLGQRGVKLSGGQKQRVSIARVFLKDPPIIIFDEATSALDNESEKAVQDALEALAHSRTTLVIAHRLSTIRNAQRVVVLSDSGIAEQGTHAELMALRGAYARLYAAQ